jgi:tetratricopeptide (TPR) repeat protein
LSHFHAAQVRTAQPLILAYAAMHYRRDHRWFSRWQAWWRGQTLHRTLTYLLNFDVSIQNGLIVAPDAMLETTPADDARQRVGDFLIAYRRPFHNHLLRRFHRHAEAQRWALFDLAMGCYGQGQEHAAAGFYTMAIKVAPHFGFYVNRGNAHADQGDLPAAIADYDQAIALNPQYADAHNNRGNARANQGNLPAAIADYDQAIALNPQYAAAYYNRGLVRYTQGDLPAAIADYDQAIALNPQHTGAYNNRGLAHANQGNFSAAIADYDQAITLNPQHTGAYYNRGNARVNQGDLPAAIADYDQAIALNPQYADAYNNRGLTHANQGDLPAAIADYDQAIALNPQYPGTYYNRGNAHANRGNLFAAIANYEQAIVLNPQYAAAYYNRGLVRYVQKQVDEAIIDYRKALENADALPAQGLMVYRSLGACLREQAKWQEALTTYRQVLTLDDSRLGDWLALADVARHAGDEQTWQEALAQARRRLPTDAAYHRACLESVAGNVEEALAALTEATQVDDFDPTGAHQDPDLAWVRADSRFAEIVGKIIDTKDISADKLEPAEGERQVTVAETKSASKV